LKAVQAKHQDQLEVNHKLNKQLEELNTYFLSVNNELELKNLNDSNDFKSSLGTLMLENENLSKRSAEVNSIVTSLTEERNQLEVELNLTKTLLEDENRTVKKQSQINLELEAKLNNIQVELDNENHLRQQLNEKILSLQSSHESEIENLNKIFDAKLSDVNSQLKNFGDELLVKENELKKANEIVEKQTVELKDLKNQLERASDSTVSDCREKLDSEKQKIAKLNENIKSLNSIIKENKNQVNIM
jgi:chromosome segregation ATPase